ncbi:MAG TPA: serine hydrolase domain-containing protein [Blastocatellia bacterium]|nr:serine hydrolase domain-containing protein [Blastocatellia bacterium]
MRKQRRINLRVLVLFLTLSLTLTSLGQSTPKQAGTASSRAHMTSLPRATPESVGLSSERLARIRAVVQQYVDQGRIAGATTLVMRKGKVAHLEAVGRMDEGKPMREDTIFRIASMTKAVTSVAVMVLYEEGKLLLDDPVSKYIPEFKGAQVAIPSEDKKSYTLVAAKSEITVRHLLTHTSGLTYNFIGIEPWAKLYKDAGISDGLVQTEGTIGDKIKKLAKLPLMHNPGERFSYSLSTDVLGYLVEVVSGMTLDEFFGNRLFEPLNMKDTHFFLPEEKLGRLAAVYNQLPDGRIKRMSDEPDVRGYLVYSATFQHKGPRTYYSGGAGLVSTITDYARFLQMLLNGGSLDGARVLSRKTVELMTVNHVGDMFGGQGFGLGLSVLRDLGKGSELGSVGQYGWGGFFYTVFFVDPKEKMIGIFMSQLYPANDVRLQERFRSLAFQTIVD